MRKKRVILVTGGAGFVGTNLIKLLLIMCRAIALYIEPELMWIQLNSYDKDFARELLPVEACPSIAIILPTINLNSFAVQYNLYSVQLKI